MKSKKLKPKRKFSFIILFSISVFVCYLIIMWFNLRVDSKEKRAELERLNAQYSQQLEDNSRLSKQIKDGLSDEELEKIARDELGYAMPDEHVYADASGTQ